MQWKENLWEELRWGCYCTVWKYDQEQQGAELKHQNKSQKLGTCLRKTSHQCLRGKKYKLFRSIKQNYNLGA